MDRHLTIRHRESLVYLLCEAAELEHALMCGYLYAAFSLKEPADPGLSPEQGECVRHWRTAVTAVAVQEMLHLATVNNLLVALGEAPHFSRPNLPVPGRYFPDTVRLGLLPFGEEALRHFLYLERPEGVEREDVGDDEALGHAIPVMADDDIAPFGQEFDTVGHLYREIRRGLDELVQAHGECWVFIGARSQQTAGEVFQWPELAPVTDLASARAAIDLVIEQGEGAEGDWRNGHYGQFLQVLLELIAARDDDPSFEPARPVVPVRTRVPPGLPEQGHGAVLVTDPGTARVVDAFHVANETLLQVLSRIFGHSTETLPELGVLADTAVGLMHAVMGPLGRALGRMPVGEHAPGATAGPTFDLFYTDGYLLPQQEAFWTILHERLVQLAGHVATIAAADVRGELDAVERVLRALADGLTVNRPDLAARFSPATV